MNLSYLWVTGINMASKNELKYPDHLNKGLENEVTISRMHFAEGLARVTSCVAQIVWK